MDLQGRLMLLIFIFYSELEAAFVGMVEVVALGGTMSLLAHGEPWTTLSGLDGLLGV
jgi:hypothetical protein